MTTVLQAHYDGKAILPDQEVDLPVNKRLKLFVALAESEDENLDQLRQDWARLGRQSLERAYGDDEPEYTDADVIR